MMETGTESLTMVSIFMPLADAVCAGFEIVSPLRNTNTLIVGDKIVTMRSKEINRCGRGRGWSILLGAMLHSS